MAGKDEIYSALLATAAQQARAGNLAAALAACQKAVAQQPKRPEAWYNRGILRRMSGAPAAALDDLSQAARLAPDRDAYGIEWQKTLTFLPPGRLPGPVAATALRLLDLGKVDLQDCASHLAQHLKSVLGPALDAVGDWGRPLWDRACDPFVLAYLGGVLNIDPAIERFLRDLRIRLVGMVRDDRMSPALWRLAAAFARQLDRNGGVLLVTDPERMEAERLAATLPAAPGGAIRAMYGDWADLAGMLTGDAAPLGAVIADLEDERRVEAGLAADLANLGGGGAVDAVSGAVRAQYENFPYPRWRKLAPVLPGARLEEIGRLMPERAGRPVGSVLIAGCGTGRQAVAAGTAYGPGTAISAIDLSRASLAYGLRQARAAGQGAIRFLQCDLLEVGLLEARFDVIECVGVLHHMADPLAGLRALKGRLNQGGLVKIGLYSRAARHQLDPFRAELAVMDGPLDRRVRQLRAAILDGRIGTPDQRARVLDSADFYALQEAIDLLGHVHEQEMDLPAIARLLDQAGLDFRGFSLGDPRPEANFQAVHGRPARGATLAEWEMVEQARPETFRTMYNFWAGA